MKRYAVVIQTEATRGERAPKYSVEAGSTIAAVMRTLDALFSDTRPQWLSLRADLYLDSVDRDAVPLPVQRVNASECRDNCCERCHYTAAGLDELGGGR